MKLLVDTHVLLWSAVDPSRIGGETRASMEDGANELFASVVSAWEIAIKQSLGKLDLPRPAERWLPEMLRRTGYQIAEPSLEAALRVRGLPWHHRDPFDRLLIAHALQDGYTIVTHDDAFAAYGVPLLLA
jgi:PIN domain nuclease of toxin-antitoxin system